MNIFNEMLIGQKALYCNISLYYHSNKIECYIFRKADLNGKLLHCMSIILPKTEQRVCFDRKPESHKINRKWSEEIFN